MRISYTKHALEKLKRQDIRNFKITKKTIRKILIHAGSKSRTKYGAFSVVSQTDLLHDLRVVYVIIEEEIKVITFHITRKGRYK